MKILKESQNGEFYKREHLIFKYTFLLRILYKQKQNAYL